MRKPPPRRLFSFWFGSLASAVLVVGLAGPAAAARPAPTERPGPGSLPVAALDTALAGIHTAGMIGVFAEVRDGRATWRGASGIADINTGRPVRPDYRHRVGSVTKTFVAATVLQLVGEGRISLDAPVRRYLPGLMPDDTVTVRMLLGHRSGIGTYDQVLFATPELVEEHRNTTFRPRELARVGLGMPATNPPGAAFSYSNTNYILAGLIVEQVTGRPAAEEVSRRILRPLGLRDTYFPGTDPRITGPHSRGYVPWYEGELRDFTVYNMSWGYTAGELISTTADLDTFYRALLGGRLLRPAQQADLVRFLPTGTGVGYGLGLLSLPLACGDAYGHDGQVFGYTTLSLHSPDGRRQVSVAQNASHYQYAGDPISAALFQFLDTALCGPQSTDAARTATARTLPLTPAPGLLPPTRLS
ncbi:serine hydrolase domain-containing protein [Micromonospora sp. NBC_01796]|uniref:serine hydrolase domain-containing protein n=1 Tax=Micromonospora sp. NBC_01796 TaxID=2975987 RepID=UPI002DDA302B|nr:serine hydrolase domain-containing protein [Micromonospora sp. NBC_01796]WSA87335.1 beta-lactamase family protein [Micromonospora sp. NBC_01796]